MISLVLAIKGNVCAEHAYRLRCSSGSISSTLTSVRPRLHRLFRLGGGLLAWRDLLDGGELPMKWPLLRVKQYLTHMG
jgi:hypothetical protein